MDDAQFVAAFQTVISPVVLISGIGMLVLSMTNRYSHGTNRVRALADEWKKGDAAAKERLAPQIRHLERRLHSLRNAISLAVGSVLLVALLIVALMTGYIVGVNFRGLIIVLFGLSQVFLVVSLVLFVRDTSQSLAALRRELRDVD
jgi:predicted membrane channel-forming protein YqfA (hemolysin III family)